MLCKYLDFVIIANGSLSEGVEELAVSVRKALHTLLVRARELRSLSVSTMCYLFDALVQPIMLCLSEILGVVEFGTLEKIL